MKPLYVVLAAAVATAVIGPASPAGAQSNRDTATLAADLPAQEFDLGSRLLAAARPLN